MRIICVAVAGLLAVGCGPKDAKTLNKSLNQARKGDLKDWVDAAPPGCAVGTAPMPDRTMRSMASTASGSMARAELARQMKTKIEGMLKTYQNMQTKDGKISSEQDITNVTRDIVNQDMYGTRLIKTEQRKDVFYALVCIDPSALEEAIGKMNQLGEAMRAAVKKRARTEFKDLDANLGRLGATPPPSPVQQTPAPAPAPAPAPPVQQKPNP
jgi:hypothetical protein